MNWKKKDKNIWALLDAGGFSVNKSGILFTAIGSDHDIEQESCALIESSYWSNQGYSEFRSHP